MPKRLRVAFLDRCIGCYQCVLACSRVNEKVLSLDRASIHVKTIGGYGREGFAVIVCRGCLDPPCVPVCPIKEAIRSKTGGGVLVNRSICDATICKQECVHACSIPGAIHVGTDIHKAIVCRQCSICTKFCPTEV
ncbi:MAG: (Fe-S)-binding protein, partial [Candidatus Hodarchaeales archaeon]